MLSIMRRLWCVVRIVSRRSAPALQANHTSSRSWTLATSSYRSSRSCSLLLSFQMIQYDINE
jgi:hypothetical protein